MTPEELLNLLKANTNNLPVYGQSGRRLSTKRARIDGKTPRVYAAENIADLLNQLDRHDFSIRFVIDKNGRPFFAEIGPLVGSTPGHEEMSGGLCLASGVIALSPDHRTATDISYQSGYFKPSLSSLLWILKYLFSAECVFKLSENFNIAYFPDPEPIGSWPILRFDTQTLREAIDPLSPKAMAFTEGFDEPFASYADEAPRKRQISGIACSGSFEDLAKLGIEASAIPNNVSVTQRSIFSARKSAAHEEMTLPGAHL